MTATQLATSSPTARAMTRMVVATDWTAPTHVICAFQAFAQLWHPRAPTGLVIAVPHEPADEDAQRAQRIVAANPAPVGGPMIIESFAEALGSAYEAALVPDGEPASLLVESGDFIARMGQLTTALGRTRNEGDPDDLSVSLGRVREVPDGIEIDLLKVDVEGAEELVFDGMEGLLKSGAVDRVAFECMREQYGSILECLHDQTRPPGGFRLDVGSSTARRRHHPASCGGLGCL